MYYHHVTHEVHQLTMFYFSALNSPFPVLCDTGTGPCKQFSSARWFSVSFINRETRQGHSRGRGFHSGWGALSPLKCAATASCIGDTQRCSLPREFLAHSANCFLRISSGPPTSLPSFSTQWAALTDQLQPAPSGECTGHQQAVGEYSGTVTSFPVRSGVGRGLLQAFSASILHSPSAPEESTFFHLLFLYSSFTPLVVVKHSFCQLIILYVKFFLLKLLCGFGLLNGS